MFAKRLNPLAAVLGGFLCCGVLSADDPAPRSKPERSEKVQRDMHKELEAQNSERLKELKSRHEANMKDLERRNVEIQKELEARRQKLLESVEGTPKGQIIIGRPGFGFSPGAGPGSDSKRPVEFQIRHLRMAAMNLSAAGFHEEAEKLKKQADELERQVERPKLSPENQVLFDEIQELKQTVQELRKELSDLRKQLPPHGPARVGPHELLDRPESPDRRPGTPRRMIPSSRLDEPVEGPGEPLGLRLNGEILPTLAQEARVIVETDMVFELIPIPEEHPSPVVPAPYTPPADSPLPLNPDSE